MTPPVLTKVEQFPWETCRAPPIASGLLECISRAQVGCKGIWEESPASSRYTQLSHCTPTLFPSTHPRHRRADTSLPRYPRALGRSSAGFSTGFEPSEESSVLCQKKLAYLAPNPPSPSLSSTQGAWLPHRSFWFNLAVPVMPRLWEPGPSPCPPHSSHGQPLLDSLSHSRPPAASSLLTTAPLVLATPFWLLLRCWCSPKRPSSPPIPHQIPS